jgi:hypothetical protein
MIFNKMFFDLLQEQNILKTSKTQPLVDAIRKRHPITFYYTGPQKPERDRVLPGTRESGEPVALGLSKKGNLIIRVFVPTPNVSKKGFDKTQWRTFMVSRMSNVRIDDEVTFDEKRPQYKDGDDDSMTVTYVTSDWTHTPEPQPQAEPTAQPQGQPEPQVPTPEPQAEPTPTPQVEPTPQNEPTPPTELPQPEPQQIPPSIPQTSPDDVNITPNTTQTTISQQDYQKSVKDLYNQKRNAWIDSQRQIGGNINPGEGTRSRLSKEADREMKDKLSKDGIKLSDEQNRLQESLNRIKTLMLF